MTIETFIEKFDLLAKAPNAVEKLRELVLQLAVTGKLVEQDSRETPASTLMAEARSERDRLVSDRQIRARPAKAVHRSEHPFNAPASWAWARLADVGHEIGQKVPDERFTYIDVGSIDSDRGIVSSRAEELDPGEAPSRARKLVSFGTVIYSTVRPYLRNIAVIDRDFDCEPIASTAFGILHPFAGISSRYLFYWLRSAPFTDYVQEQMKGMAYPAINEEKFYSGLIAIPPIEEQDRIVSKLDYLIGLVDQLEAEIEESQTTANRLMEAAVAELVAGD